MINCHISFPNPLTHLLHIELKFNIKNRNKTNLILPAWRPGRYELAQFVENIQGFTATSRDNLLHWEKTRPNVWTVDTTNVDELTIGYQYYANKMDAGNSVLDDHLIYINFINCMMFIDALQSEEIALKINIPNNFKSVCSLTQVNTTEFKADSYQQLVDSPLMSSPDLELLHYNIENHRFTIAILGDCPLDRNVLVSDFEKFSRSQIGLMGGFPTAQYDFQVHSLDYNHYHGVEHQNSTVLVLGPNDEASKSSYFSKLMGVASHELFHTWNVTRIRPTEMSPYDFSTETMTKTGFVTEGFTTYFGDWFLKQSGVFDQEEYFNELNILFKRHFENYGRRLSSLIQSSENLWVDGYKNLFPSKKVSIYVKGALCALILDLEIMKSSENKRTLIDVVKELYVRHSYSEGGYTIDHIYDILCAHGNDEMYSLLNTLYETTHDLLPYLQDALSYVGCTLTPMVHVDEYTAQLGIKVHKNKITEIAPGSHTENYLAVGDQLLSCNDKEFDFAKPNLSATNLLTVKRGSRIIEVEIPVNDQSYYETVKIVKETNCTNKQQENLNLWLGNNLK